MNQQNISKTPDLLVIRKRGRPRKDESVPRNVKQHTHPAPPLLPPPPLIEPPPTIFPVSKHASRVDPNMVGQALTCVIDGIFDNGYLLSACVGPTNTLLRGIVFQHGHVAPITPANDVAPHVKMCKRGEFPIPPSNPTNPIQISTPEPVCAKQPVEMQNYQNTPAMVTGGSSSTSVPQESLRLVQQDDLMQVFEISKTVEESQDCDQKAKNEQVVSDPTAESFPERYIVIDKVTELEPVVNAGLDEQLAKDPDEKKREVVTPVETVLENQPPMANDELQHESGEQTGEMSNIDSNEDQNRVPAVDLSLSNFPEI